MFARLLWASVSLVNMHVMPLHTACGIPTHTVRTCLPRLQSLGLKGNSYLARHASGDACTAANPRLLHALQECVCHSCHANTQMTSLGAVTTCRL